MTEAAPITPTRSGVPRPPRLAIVLALAALVAVPFLVAVVALHGQAWFPTGDLAQAEMRVRDVPAHLPLVGAAGRIAAGSIQGSHPGPLMFWLLAPAYRLGGGTAWALELSCALLNVGWIIAVALVARRRGGLSLVLGVLGVAALLVQGFGLSALTQPWNPYTPLVPFLLFLLLTWSVLDGDVALLPVAVVVGSYCIQCHVGYLAPVGALLALAAVWRRTDWRRASFLIALLAGVVVWIPPLVQQLRESPGNLWILYRYFRYSPERPIGWLRGVEVTLVQLEPWGNWLTGSWRTSGSGLGGLAFVLVWALLAVLTWREDERLRALHVVGGVAVVVACIAGSRIFGTVWGYIVEWMWCITGLGVLASGWSAWLLVRRARPSVDARWARACAAIVLVGGVGFGVADGAGVKVPSERISRQEQVLATETLARIERTRRYLVDWRDPIGLGGTGFGLMLQLERHGIAVGTLPVYGTGVRAHRVFLPGDYDATLQVVTGYYVTLWRADPAATEVACVDVRSDAERRESLRLERELIADLRARGRGAAAADLVRTNLFAVYFDETLPQADIDKAKRLLDLMETVAVFSTPASHSRLSRQVIEDAATWPADRLLGTTVGCDPAHHGG